MYHSSHKRPEDLQAASEEIVRAAKDIQEMLSTGNSEFLHEYTELARMRCDMREFKNSLHSHKTSHDEAMANVAARKIENGDFVQLKNAPPMLTYGMLETGKVIGINKTNFVDFQGLAPGKVRVLYSQLLWNRERRKMEKEEFDDIFDATDLEKVQVSKLHGAERQFRTGQSPDRESGNF